MYILHELLKFIKSINISIYELAKIMTFRFRIFSFPL